LSYDKNTQNAYVAGASDTLITDVASKNMDAKTQTTAYACTAGKTLPQLTAIFRKWLNENPEKRHMTAALLYPLALFETCAKVMK